MLHILVSADRTPAVLLLPHKARVRRRQLLQVEVANVAHRHSNAVSVFDRLSWLLADLDLVRHFLKAVEVALQVVLREHEPQLAHDANVEVLVAEAGPKLDPVRLLDDIEAAFFVVEPGHAHFEALVDVVFRVGEAIVEFLHDVFVEATHLASLVVELQDAQVGKQLALLHVAELGAAHCRIQIEELNGTAVVGDGGDGPGAAAGLCLDTAVGDLVGA